VMNQLSNVYIEEAIAEMLPEIPEGCVRALARLVRLCMENKLTTIDFLGESAKDEVLHYLRKTNPQLAGVGEAVNLLVDVGRAMDRRMARNRASR